MESMDAPGDLTVASNYTYNASKTKAAGLSRTRVIITTTTSVDGGATWTTIDTGVGPAMTVSETMHYDGGRVPTATLL